MNNSTTDAVWELAQTAIMNGIQPQEVVKELAQAWDEHLDDDRKRDKEVFSRMLRIPGF